MFFNSLLFLLIYIFNLIILIQSTTTKNKVCLFGGIILLILAGIDSCGIGINNSIKTTEQAVQKQWAQVETT